MIKNWDADISAWVVLIPFPPAVREAVTKNGDDSYTIFINENLSEKRRFEAFRHAMSHLSSDDYSSPDAQEIEARRHAGG